jgi:hypothetical protein
MERKPWFLFPRFFEDVIVEAVIAVLLLKPEDLLHLLEQVTKRGNERSQRTLKL